MEKSLIDEITTNEKLYIKKEEEFRFSKFMKEIMKDKVTKKDALLKAELSESILERLLRNNPEYQKKYEKSYTLSRMRRFISKFEYYNYDYALKKTGLIQTEIDDWLKKGQKMSKIDEENIFSKFLSDCNRVSVKKYIESRKKKNTVHKSAKKVHKTPAEIERIINENPNFKKELDSILVSYALEEFKKGKSKSEVMKILDLNENWFVDAIAKGQDGDETFKELYGEYSENIISNELERFLEIIKDKPLKSALAELNITETELNSWCEKARNGDEAFKEFYDKFFEFKKQRYIKTMMKTRSKQKALKKSYLTPQEFLSHEDELEREIFAKSMDIITAELEKGKTTKDACKKASVKIDVIYRWLEEGLKGNDDFTQFAEVYKNEYLKPIEKAYAIGIRQGISEKFIIKAMKRSDFLVNDDVKYLKRLDLFPKPENVVIDFDEDFDMDLDEFLSLGI